jgi:hydrogenase expression/formation protein HypD
MKILNGYTDRQLAAKTISSIIDIAARLSPRVVNLMEVCGTHTAAIMKNGIRALLPENVRLLSGPGCPVCVTPPYLIDCALQLAERPDVILTTFGDMMRVPATRGSLEDAKGRGADIKVVYSPLELLALSKENAVKHIVFFSIGFETTAPAIAWTVKQAEESGLKNLSIIPANKLLPPVLAELANAPDLAIDGFLCPGHVSVITGSSAFAEIAQEEDIASVVAGFEPLDILLSIQMLLRQILDGRAEVEIEYTRAVNRTGNKKAQTAMESVFEPVDSIWRGLGLIKNSGLGLRKKYADFEALVDLTVEDFEDTVASGCICGEIIKGATRPTDCSLFQKVCTPETPVGPCIISSEGTCSVYYAYCRS